MASPMESWVLISSPCQADRLVLGESLADDLTRFCVDLVREI